MRHEREVIDSRVDPLSEFRGDIGAALVRLSLPERLALALHYMEDLTTEDDKEPPHHEGDHDTDDSDHVTLPLSRSRRRYGSRRRDRERRYRQW